MSDGHHPLCSKLRHAADCGCWERGCLDQMQENRRLRAALAAAMGERDAYWQALVDIDGHESWEAKTMGDIAREALAAAGERTARP